MVHRHASRQTVWQIFATPLVIAVLSAVGLIAALVGDGLWDGLSWTALGIPVAIFAVCMLKPRRRA